jgi:hypothetical protein
MDKRDRVRAYSTGKEKARTSRAFFFESPTIYIE